MPNSTYYSSTTDGRAEWWENIVNNGGPILTALGVASAQVTSILNDAKWGVYLYRTIRTAYETSHEAIIAYANTIADGMGGVSGEPLPPPPEPPVWPTLPTAVITCDFERRRELWVQAVKNLPLYTPTQGELLRVVRPGSSFEPATYQAVLLSAVCSGPRTLSGKFRKAYGNVDGVLVRGRKVGSATWLELGKFTATPFSVLVPLTSSALEEWEFEVQAFKRDLPIGLPSASEKVVIKP